MQLDGYEIDVLVQGFPGRSVYHGGLGWGAVVLVRGHGRVVLVDSGSFGMRKLLVERLKACGVTPPAVTDLIVSHAHHDHVVNWPLFERARIFIGDAELRWSLTQPAGATPVPEFTMAELQRCPRLKTLGDGDEPFPGLRGHLTPGHTPGHLSFVLAGAERDVILTADAAKNRAELVSRKTDMTYDAAVSAASITKIWDLWRRPGSIVIPGHDVPMTQEGGRIAYVGKREAAVKAWYGDDMETTTLIDLTTP